MEKITTLEQAQSLITKETMDTMHLGAMNIGEDGEVKKIMEWLFEEILPPLKIFKWGEILEWRQSKRFLGFQGLRNKSLPYFKFLPHGYSSLEMNGNHAGFGFQTNDKDINILDSIIDIRPSQKEDPTIKELVGSCYYHSAKAHWLVQSIQKEGLWAPIQGYTNNPFEDKIQFTIHPGSVRSCVFEEMENDNMECMIWD